MGAQCKKQFGPYSYHTWTVRMNPLAHEGRDVWEHSGLPIGTRVALSVQTLPEMLCSIGQFANRRQSMTPVAGGPVGTQDNGQFGWVNKSIVRVGPFPPSYPTILTVGCELHVIPGWQLPLLNTTAAIAPPLDNSLDGIDVRPFQGYEHARVQVWMKVTDGSADLITPAVWLRHPSGIWAQAARRPAFFFPVGVGSVIYDVPVHGADRLAVSFDFFDPPSGSPISIAYGLATAPSEAANRQEFQIRFGAVVAPYE